MRITTRRNGKMTPIIKFGPVASYVAWVRRFIPRPIQSEEEYLRAMIVIDQLLSRKELDSGETDYLKAVSVFAEAYETDHVILNDVHGVEMLQALMEMNGL